MKNTKFISFLIAIQVGLISCRDDIETRTSSTAENLKLESHTSGSVPVYIPFSTEKELVARLAERPWKTSVWNSDVPLFAEWVEEEAKITFDESGSFTISPMGFSGRYWISVAEDEPPILNIVPGGTTQSESSETKSWVPVSYYRPDRFKNGRLLILHMRPNDGSTRSLAVQRLAEKQPWMMLREIHTIAYCERVGDNFRIELYGNQFGESVNIDDVKIYTELEKDIDTLKTLGPNIVDIHPHMTLEGISKDEQAP